jgi:hypothetical protein
VVSLPISFSTSFLFLLSLHNSSNAHFQAAHAESSTKGDVDHETRPEERIYLDFTPTWQAKPAQIKPNTAKKAA